MPFSSFRTDAPLRPSEEGFPRDCGYKDSCPGEDQYRQHRRRNMAVQHQFQGMAVRSLSRLQPATATKPFPAVTGCLQPPSRHADGSTEEPRSVGWAVGPLFPAQPADHHDERQGDELQDACCQQQHHEKNQDRRIQQEHSNGRCYIRADEGEDRFSIHLDCLSTGCPCAERRGFFSGADGPHRREQDLQRPYLVKRGVQLQGPRQRSRRHLGNGRQAECSQGGGFDVPGSTKIQRQAQWIFQAPATEEESLHHARGGNGETASEFDDGGMKVRVQSKDQSQSVVHNSHPGRRSTGPLHDLI
jgi:hypothetical protein